MLTAELVDALLALELGTLLELGALDDEIGALLEETGATLETGALDEELDALLITGALDDETAALLSLEAMEDSLELDEVSPGPPHAASMQDIAIKE